MTVITIITIIFIIASIIIYVLAQQGICYTCKHYKKSLKGIEYSGVCKINNRIRSAFETCLKYRSRYK